MDDALTHINQFGNEKSNNDRLTFSMRDTHYSTSYSLERVRKEIALEQSLVCDAQIVPDVAAQQGAIYHKPK